MFHPKSQAVMYFILIPAKFWLHSIEPVPLVVMVVVMVIVTLDDHDNEAHDETTRSSLIETNRLI